MAEETAVLRTPRRARRRAVGGAGGAAALLAAGVLLAACGSGSPPTASTTTTGPRATTTTSTSTTAAPATTVAPTTTTAAPTTTTSLQSALDAAVAAFQASQGVTPSSYRISAVAVSTVDATWARFSVGPTSATETSFQGGYGYLHQSGGAWNVVGFGSAEVGCSPESGGVPPAVLAGFGTTCPTGG